MLEGSSKPLPDDYCQLDSEWGVFLKIRAVYFARWYFKNHPEESKLSIKYLKNRQGIYSNHPKRTAMLADVEQFAKVKGIDASVLLNSLQHSFLRTPKNTVIALVPKPRPLPHNFPQGGSAIIRKGVECKSISKKQFLIKAIKVPIKNQHGYWSAVLENEALITPHIDEGAYAVMVARQDSILPYIIRDYFNAAELFFYAKDVLGGLELPNQKKVIYNVLLGVARQMQSFHEQKQVVHRDLKSENVLIAVNEHYKVLSVEVIDFGMSRLIKELSKIQEIQGTKGFVAPEILYDCSACSSKADVWSFGNIILQLNGQGYPNPNFLTMSSKDAEFALLPREAILCNLHCQRLVELCVTKIFVPVAQRSEFSEIVIELLKIMDSENIVDDNATSSVLSCTTKPLLFSNPLGSTTDNQLHQKPATTVKHRML